MATFHLSTLLILAILNFMMFHYPAIAIFPPACNQIECPSYTVIATGDGFEIRSIDSSVWITTAPIADISFINATQSGFHQLYNYIQGNNDEHQKIEMTAPVLTDVQPSEGPFCDSTFQVSFYVPKVNQGNPPSENGLKEQNWGVTYVAVRQFDGFAADDNVGKEAAALYGSIAGTNWSDAVNNRHENATDYIVAQYNSPMEFKNRVNEIWITFDWES